MSVPLQEGPLGAGGDVEHPLFTECSMDRGAWWATVHGVAKGSASMPYLSITDETDVIILLTGEEVEVHQGQ